MAVQKTLNDLRTLAEYKLQKILGSKSNKILAKKEGCFESSSETDSSS